MTGKIWKFSDQIDEEDVEMLRKDFITFAEGAEYYRIGMKPFVRMCREAGAAYKIGKMVRVNRHILERYFREIMRKEEKTGEE